MTDQGRTAHVNLPKRFEFVPSSIARGSLRGLKRCPGCGQLNGVRSSICRNEDCKLRKDALRLHIPLDPIRLESLDKRKTLYSLRSKEKNAQPRNFVLSTAACGSDSTTFECYSCCPSGINNSALCKHILACNTTNVDSLPQAEIFPISRDVLWNLNGLDEEHKKRLWSIYQQEENSVPAVQRISSSLFVVRCDESKVFPAGRLHVTAVSNGISTRKGIYSCSCKKLKIIVEPDNSVVMQEEVCDHILLVLAAVLSNRKGKTAYGNFASALKSYWMPTSIETPIVDSTQEDALFGLSIDIGGNFDMERSDSRQVDDIFIYNNDFMSDGNIPDFEDIILNYPLNSVENLQSQNISDNCMPTNAATNPNDILHPGDPNLGLSFAITAEDVEDIQLHNAPSINGVKAVQSNLASNLTTAHLELSDCKIELMDQFELTDQIDLSTTDDITLQQEQTWLGNGISILEAPVLNSTASTIGCNEVSPVLETPSTTPHTAYYDSNSLLKTNQVVEAPPIELPTIAMVKKYPVKASELVNEVNTRKFPPLPAKRSLIINGKLESEEKQTNVGSQTNDIEEPSLAFSAWLDYVIEVINESVGTVEERNVEHTFHVHEEIFAHFSKRFSTGIKLRTPNSTTVVKAGKYKGLFKYVWYFSNATTIRRIFTTKNISLDTERIFEYNSDGIFVPYVRQPIMPAPKGKHKRVYPKLSLYKTHIWLESGSSEYKNNFKIEWLPGAFPKSHHGMLKLEFSVVVQDPHEMQRAIEGK
ncbi:uncharacterized protein LOC128855908 [Anastrepha ludens]|uniref:uncharacterized protein LOC128855908 n=1 Tax=Anastrepha ludens TaxID=28586 RepID=UPI0023B193F5|nr:uncharacterized protein LOC128855908 [Anastrepha ludens]